MSELDHHFKYSTTSFIFASATFLENLFIRELNAFTAKLKQRGLFPKNLSLLNYNAAFSKAQAKSQQITVEFVPARTQVTAFGNALGQVVDAGNNTHKMFGGKWNYTGIFTCRSINRAPVATLADILILGLLMPVREAVVKQGVDLPINNIAFDKIAPDRDSVPGMENLFRLQFNIPDITVDWRQFYDEAGDIADIVDVEMTQY